MSERFEDKDVPKSVEEALVPGISSEIDELETRMAFELSGGNPNGEEMQKIAGRLSHIKQQQRRIIDHVASAPLSKPAFSGNIVTMNEEEFHPIHISTEGVEELRRKEVAEIARITEELEAMEAKAEDSQPDFRKIEELNLLREQARRRLNELSG